MSRKEEAEMFTFGQEDIEVTQLLAQCLSLAVKLLDKLNANFHEFLQ